MLFLKYNIIYIMASEYKVYDPWNINRNNNVFNKSHQILIYGHNKYGNSMNILL